MSEDKSFSKKLDRFFDGKGFYIVLALCVALLGVSAYFLLTGNDGTDVDQQTMNESYTEYEDDPETALTIPMDDEGDGGAAEPVDEPESEDETEVWNEQEAETAVSAAMIWPVEGEIDIPYSMETLVYNERLGDWRTSSRVELKADVGTQVLACAAGIVKEVYMDDINGMTVVIEHSGGLVSVYSNLASTPTVCIGDNVMTGEVIGSVGTTALGESEDNAHLCFSMLLDGQNVDPALYLPAR
jgi:murein DD-endopeptidase MepM/ murein hydrolase activator NlpD